jgi:hypothetical protein
VLGREHPSTLTSVYCLAHLLAEQHHYQESLGLYERAFTGYCTVLGERHPTTQACRQLYSDAQASAANRERDTDSTPMLSDRSANADKKKASKLARGLAE